MLFNSRGRISRFQATKYGLMVLLILALIVFVYDNVYIAGAVDISDSFFIILAAITLGSGLVLITKRFHDLGAPFWASELLIAIVCAIYWFGFASPERSIEQIATENLAQNPSPIFNGTEQHEYVANDPASGELLGIVVSIDALNLNNDQRVRLSKANALLASGAIAAWVLGLVLAVLLFLIPGTRGENKYGPDPLGVS